MEIISPSVCIETPESHIREYSKLIERYGRTCYKSEEEISEDSAEEFILKNIIEKGHESILEHCSITARFICDRSASHQLVRHRIGSFSQESQRVVDYSRGGIQVICPPTIRNNEQAFSLWKEDIETAEKAYRDLLQTGVPPEDARSVLPNCTKTEVVTTFNLRQWRYVFMRRALNPQAQWEIRELMTELLKQMYKHMPIVFQDLQQKILYRLVFENPQSTEE